MEGDEGSQAIRIARGAIERALGASAPRDAAEPYRSEALAPVFDERRGVFTTLKRRSDGGLRGCIGFPLPVYPLRAAIPRTAVAAAVEDPRFPPLAPRELPGIFVEVSILTPPVPLPGEPRDRGTEVVVGRDGLLVESDAASGLLLPQVAPEQGWDARRFLDETCRKAGLPARAWESDEVTVRRFQAEIFSEGPDPTLRRSGASD